MIQSFLGFLGRGCLSLIFIFSSIHKILSWRDTENAFTQALAYWKSMIVTTAEMPVPPSFLEQVLEFAFAHTSQLLALATVFEFLGGVLLFLGISVRIGSFLLLLFLLPATVIFHHFWDFTGAQKQIEMVNFMKNLSILGGLLFVLAWGKGSCGKKSSAKEESE